MNNKLKPSFHKMVYPKKKSENRAIFSQEKNANVDDALKDCKFEIKVY